MKRNDNPKILGKKQLSQILSDQLNLYNKQHPGNALSDISIFDMATSFYNIGHPDRYRILQHWLEPELQDKLYLYNITWKKHHEADHGAYKSIYNGTYSGLYLPSPHYNELMLSEQEGKNYLAGDYQFSSKHAAISKDGWNEDALICNPSLLFYTLARTVFLDEKRLHDAFQCGEGLNSKMYDKFCIFDIADYYTKKADCSIKELANRINKRGFGKSTLYKLLLNPDYGITIKQFLTLAEVLDIPKKWLEFCLLRFEHMYTFFPYQHESAKDIADPSGQIQGISIPDHLALVNKKYYRDLERELERLRKVVSVYECITTAFEPRPVHKLCQNLGYQFSTFTSGRSQDSVPDRHLQKQNIQMQVVCPDGSTHMLESSDYSEIMENIEEYARHLMEDKLK